MKPRTPARRRRGRTYNTDAVVTGAASGLGRAFALELASRGSRVICADIDAEGAHATVELITAQGGASLAVDCDVSDVLEVQKMADAAEDWLGGPVRLLVNNAGIGTGGHRVGHTDLREWHRTLGVNLWGVVHGCQVFVPRMALGGGIINVASAASFAAVPRMAAYNVSKAGVLALSETLAAELSGAGIKVTVLCPTLVRTNITHNEGIDPSAARFAEVLMGKFGSKPDSVARAALDAHERGAVHALPQVDARLVWRIKRLAPSGYTLGMGLIDRAVRARAETSPC